jgi:hydrogenase expression/formation protein HypC
MKIFELYRYLHIFRLSQKSTFKAHSMCLAVPGKILSINETDPDLKMAKVKFGGVVQDVCIQWIDDVKVGDYIMSHIGTALSKVDEEDAKIMLESLAAMGDIDPLEPNNT